MHASKIGDLPLFATVGALAAVWLVATFGLSLTIKREYLHTFVSLQTGYADTQSNFLDHQGDDARRVIIFFMNERHWQAIRDRVRQWVLSVYATWQALMPAFFTADLQARIPDDFMPVQAVQDLNEQSPDGRRPTLQNMGLVRRMSHAAPVDGASELDRGARRPSELPSPPSVCDGGGAFTANSASVLPDIRSEGANGQRRYRGARCGGISWGSADSMDSCTVFSCQARIPASPSRVSTAPKRRRNSRLE